MGDSGKYSLAAQATKGLVRQPPKEFILSPKVVKVFLHSPFPRQEILYPKCAALSRLIQRI
jgi:hypothetical protein